MKAIVKKLKESSGITQEQLLINRHLAAFSNSINATWSRTKRYAH